MVKYIKAAVSAVLSLTMIVSMTACFSDFEPDDMGKVAWNSKAAQTKNYDSSQMSRFTKLSVDENGKLIINRKTRQNEEIMGSKDTWSVFVYMCGTDLESEDSCASDDIREMMSVGSDENLNIIVQTGGTKSWDMWGISGKFLQRYLINDGKKELLCQGESQSMGSADTLYNFLSWGVENYPAEHMAVILWDHGSGSINGVCFDELYDDDSLYLTEIEEAFTRVYDEMTCRFEFVGFDACLMATIENANMLVPHAKYMIASEELESGYGWDYEAFLSYLKENPDCTGAEAGKVICDSYYAYSEYTEEEDDATMSVTDLSMVDNFLTEFNNVSFNLAEISSELSGLAKIRRAVSKAENYGGNNQSEGYTNMVDLGDILENLKGITDNCSEAVALLEQMVVYKINGDNCPKSSGISIYYPLSVQGSNELDILRNICISPYYMGFVETVAYGMTNGTYDTSEIYDWSNNDSYYEGDFSINQNSDDNIWDDWFNDGYSGWYNTDNDMISFDVPPYVNNDCFYSMIISQESLDYVQSIHFALFKDSGDDEIIYLGEDNEVDFDLVSGEVKDCFMGEWPMLPDGQNVALYLVEEYDSYNVYSIPILLNDKEMHMRVRMERDDSNVFGEFTVLGVWEGISDSGQAGRSTVTIKEGDIIRPVYETSNIYTDEEGIIYGSKYKVGKDFNITVGQLPDADYYYSYEILDIFGSQTFTDATIFTVEDGELYGYPDDDADEYDSYFGEDFWNEDSYEHEDVWSEWESSLR